MDRTSEQGAAMARLGRAALAVALLGAGGPWSFADAAQAPAMHIRKVDNSVLAGMRGGYEGLPMITGFTVAMVSQWQDRQQQVMAQAQVDVRSLDSGRPVVSGSTSVSFQGSGGNLAETPQSGRLVSGSIPPGLRGIGQITQVAGDSNSAYNQMVVRLVPDSGAGPQSASPLQSQRSEGGYQASVTLGDGGVQIGIAGPLGQLQQRLGIGSAGSLAQLAQVHGDSQTVLNQMVLTLLTRPAGAGGGSISGLLSNMMPAHP